MPVRTSPQVSYEDEVKWGNDVKRELSYSAPCRMSQPRARVDWLVSCEKCSCLSFARNYMCFHFSAVVSFPWSDSSPSRICPLLQVIYLSESCLAVEFASFSLVFRWPADSLLPRIKTWEFNDVITWLHHSVMLRRWLRVKVSGCWRTFQGAFSGRNMSDNEEGQNNNVQSDIRDRILSILGAKYSADINRISFEIERLSDLKPGVSHDCHDQFRVQNRFFLFRWYSTTEKYR